MSAFHLKFLLLDMDTDCNIKLLKRMGTFVKSGMVLIAIAISFGFAAEAPTIQIYISKKGSDANNGSISAPLASLTAAQKAVRAARKNYPAASVEVIIKAGVYYLEQTIEFTPEDGGTPNAPVIWKAAPGEKVVLSGGKPIAGAWKKEKDGIWYTNIPETRGWKREVSIPEKYTQAPSQSVWNFRELFINGKRAIRARFPNASGETPFLYAETSANNQVKIARGSIKKSWGEEADAQINLVPRWRFFNQWNDVVGVDLDSSAIRIGPREQHFEIDKGSWFWIEGVRAELDAPGEWYLDHSAGRLYYKPYPLESMEKLEAVAPFLNRIFYLKGDAEAGTYVKYIHFEGFQFLHTTYTLGQIEARVDTDGAILLENAQHCRIANCSFDNIGGYALWLHLDSRHNDFDNNSVKNSGGGGVLLTGARLSYMDDTKVYTPGEKASKLFPIQNRITRNTVEHCGKIRYYGGGVHIDSRPASMAMEPGNYIGHNHFRDLSRNGIFLFRNQGGNVVEFNEIHDCMQTTIDGAAIHFATMNRLAAPNYIMNNYLYDIWGYEQLDNRQPRRTLANGIFLDWATSNTTVRNNVIYNAGDKEIKPIMGNWNLIIENNLASPTKIDPFLPKEIGPKGTATHCIYPEQLKGIGGVVTSADTGQVVYKGTWQAKKIAGMRNLFQYDCKQAAPDKVAQCVYQLPVKEAGMYKLCIMYFPDEKAATNATITIQHAGGAETKSWNFRKGDNLGFAIRIGEYYFEKGKPATLTISNENADGHIIADAVGVIKQ
ncbi:MAG: hypothetical protein FGM61_00875 [Sediminibacterium sp.]|nr:hypothetical protein [Sediminibacterium sp.]